MMMHTARKQRLLTSARDNRDFCRRGVTNAQLRAAQGTRGWEGGRAACVVSTKETHVPLPEYKSFSNSPWYLPGVTKDVTLSNGSAFGCART